MSLTSKAVRELYQVERRYRPDISTFIAGLAKEPHPKISVLLDEDAQMYKAAVFTYEIHYALHEGGWIVVLGIQLSE